MEPSLPSNSELPCLSRGGYFRASYLNIMVNVGLQLETNFTAPDRRSIDSSDRLRVHWSGNDPQAQSLTGDSSAELGRWVGAWIEWLGTPQAYLSRSSKKSSHLCETHVLRQGNSMFKETT